MNKNEIEKKTGEGWILARTIIEVAGKPKAHVEETLKDYIKNIEEKNFKIIKRDFNKAKKQDDRIYSAFAELEILSKNLNELVYFCFDYMPSSVEILEPQELMYKARDMTLFINDMQAKLHDANMAAKTIKQQNIKLNESFTKLLKNFVAIACVGGKTIQQVEGITGLAAKNIEIVLNALIKEQRVKKKDSLYITLK